MNKSMEFRCKGFILCVAAKRLRSRGYTQFSVSCASTGAQPWFLLRAFPSSSPFLPPLPPQVLIQQEKVSAEIWMAVIGEWPYGLRSRLCVTCMSRRHHLLEKLHGKPNALHDFLIHLLYSSFICPFCGFILGALLFIIGKILQSAFL